MAGAVLESALLLFLVIDPFGNLPFVLAVLRNLPPARYRRTIVRETSIALGVLVLFAIGGERVLAYLSVERASLAVAGGVVLFLISVKMIFGSAAELFRDSYSEDPVLVPIAVPALAGPSAVTVVMILGTQEKVSLGELLSALLLVCVATGLMLLLGRRIADFLGKRGVQAMEKFMGLLLNLFAVNMILVGIRDFLGE
jgi:multiple antibiotic resistance protein